MPAGETNVKGVSVREVAARVVRYDLAKVRQGQALIPVAFLVSFAARQIQHPLLVILAFAVDAGVLVAFARARRSFNEHVLSGKRGKIDFGSDGDEISTSEISRWILEGTTARLYGSGYSWKVSAAGASEDQMRTLLQPLLGQPIVRRRKGSVRARMLSLGALVAGIVCILASRLLDLWPLGLLGVATAFLGTAAFLTPSQKIVPGTK